MFVQAQEYAGDTRHALLTSEPLPATGETSLCLSFWMHK